jgi:hypothetical protein
MGAANACLAGIGSSFQSYARTAITTRSETLRPRRVDRDRQASSEVPTVTRPDRAASITAPTRLLTPSLP